MLKIIYLTFCIINTVLYYVHCEGLYTLLAPGTLHPYFDYNVAFTLHHADGPCEIEIGISGSNFQISKNIQMQPMSTKNVKLQMPKLEQGEYRLSVKGISGVTFENSTHLNFRLYDPLVYIQMDKPIYKPGDLVQFRVIFLNQKTHPELLKKQMTIVVKDDDQNTVEKWKNVNLTHGVYTGKFQLADHRMNGWWHIEVYDNETKLHISKGFGLIQYDLPAFEVFIEVPKNVALTDEIVRISVRANYFYGKSVKGKATVTITFWVAGLGLITLPEDRNSIEVTFPIDGKREVEFDIWNDLPKPEQQIKPDDFPCYYDVFVSVEDELTGIKENAQRKSFVLYEHDVEIKAISPGEFTYRPGQLITYSLIGQKFDGTPIQDNTNTVELIIDEYVFYGMFNENGVATFRFRLPPGLSSFIKCKYLGKTDYISSISPIVREDIPPERFQLITRTPNPQLKKDLLIEVKWTEPMYYFVYMLVGRGNIIKVEHVVVPYDSRSYNITITPTLDMIPEASIFVHYVYNDNLRFEEKLIHFENDFQNTIEISTMEEVSPGEDVEIKITTDPHSYVGVLAIDQRILKFGNDHEFKRNDIFRDLLGYKTETPPIRGSGRYPGKIAGLVSMTNAHFPWSNRQYHYVPPLGAHDGPVPRVRFPETWIFENFNITNQTEFSFIRTIPDSITTWVITGFSMNSNTGFALTKEPTKVQVFKPFFISIDLPPTVKQGEIVSIPVLIFNYMTKRAYTEVTLDNSDDEFEFVEATNEIDERALTKSKEHKRISIPSNSAGKVSFLIKPKMFGILTLKVSAITALAGDSVHQTLKVEPEGVTQYQNHAFFINLGDKQQHNESITIDIPANAVPLSEKIEFTAVGDIIGLSMKYIENLVRLPVGYGEQNMVNFVPSIMVLKYLQAIDHKSPNVTKTALNILKIGFQRELSFRHGDGSYSSYGRSDLNERPFSERRSGITGSTWLTAYVVRSFQQASEFINVDEGTITSALDFLVSKQTTNGKFAEFGHLLEFPHLNDVSLTAFVVLAFLENKEIASKYEYNINKGIEYLLRSRNDADDVYGLSITALALQKFKHPLANEVLTDLMTLSKTENGTTWWTTEAKKQKRQTLHAIKSSDIEITSYALLAILEKGATEEVIPIVKWLTKQRNSNGGFKSTQDTVVGLQALIKFAEKTGLSRIGSVDIDYVCVGVGVEDKGTIKIMPENLLMLNRHELPKSTRALTFTAKGNSSSLVQLSYSYNTIDKGSKQILQLNVNVKDNTPPKLLTLDICARYDPTDVSGGLSQTNMIAIEANLPSGYTIGKEKLEKIRDFRTILFTETKKSDTVAIVYLRSLEAGVEKCISIEATQEHVVGKQKPVPVVIYDLNNNELRTTEYYEVKSSLCDICEGNDCVADCKKRRRTSSSCHDSATFKLS